jgi:hypothetical protein
MRFAFDMWRTNRAGGGALRLVLAFLANVFYIATSRTFLVVIPILLVVPGYQVLLERSGLVGGRNFRTGDGSMALGFVTAVAGQFFF